MNRSVDNLILQIRDRLKEVEVLKEKKWEIEQKMKLQRRGTQAMIEPLGDIVKIQKKFGSLPPLGDRPSKLSFLISVI